MRWGGVPMIAAMLFATGLAGVWRLPVLPDAHAESWTRRALTGFRPQGRVRQAAVRPPMAWRS
jgi:hypothetical protein